ncbi:EAL domain-containing protein [Photobacterium damselae]|nr:EAL domain-containing protein [Photobacterium damselae]
MVLRWFSIALFLISTSVFADSVKTQNVLVIHSYHQGLGWTDAVQSGLEDITANKNIALNVSYMDSKRYQSKAYLHELVAIYRIKLRSEKYSAIVVTDDRALWLIDQLGSEIGNTPVIIGGINNYSASKHQSIAKVAGFIELQDAGDNIQLALNVKPNLKQVFLIADDTLTGKSMWQSARNYLRQHPNPDITFTRMGQYSFKEMFDQAKWLPQDSAVIFLSYFIDGLGNYMPSDEFLSQFTANASAPVFVPYSYMLNYGALGGVVTSGYKLGLGLGELLEQVLQGKVTHYPYIRPNKNEVMFNYQALSRWGISIGNEQALVVNRPLSWFERHHKELKTLGFVVLVMGSVIILLSLMIRHLRRSEQQLQRSQALFETVFDQSFQYIGILDLHGHLVSANLALQEMLGDDGVKFDRPIWRWLCWNSDAASQLNQAFLAADTEFLLRFEAKAQSQNDGIRILDISLKAMPYQAATEPQILFEARDMTSRRQMEQKLREREVSYHLLYEQQPVILLTIDNSARIQSVNQFAADLLGYHKRDLLGHKITEFYLEGILPPHQIISHSGVESREVWRRQVQYRRADGETVWVRETVRQAQAKHQLLIVGEDITSTRELEQRLAYQANHDYLTGLYNRSYFESQLELALDEVQQQDVQHAMLYIDLDQFKVINDTAGHEAGDEALKQVALGLQNLATENTILARLGGDEFAVILRHCDEKQALALGRKILHLLDDAEFLWQNTRFNFSCSLGIRLIDKTAGSPQQVHAQADTACYVAKDEGRNRLHLYRPDDEELKRREHEMHYVNRIRRALVECRFELYAQQIAPIGRSSKNHHYEILLRMRELDGSIASPGVFIPAAERYNLAHLLDRYVIQQVLSWYQQHPEAIEKLGHCSINLSGQSIGNQEFVKFLLHQIRYSTVPANKICLEITETAAIGNMTQAISLFTQLKELGCLISLDDFGSGLSSFGYLKRMPVDVLKIDGMFVRDIDKDDMDFAMVKAINELAKKMGKQTVAEFVENKAILDKLESLGVDYAQGYYFGQPKPLAELVDDLSQEPEPMI